MSISRKILAALVGLTVVSLVAAILALYVLVKQHAQELVVSRCQDPLVPPARAVDNLLLDALRGMYLMAGDPGLKEKADDAMVKRLRRRNLRVSLPAPDLPRRRYGQHPRLFRAGRQGTLGVHVVRGPAAAFSARAQAAAGLGRDGGACASPAARRDRVPPADPDRRRSRRQAGRARDRAF